MFQTVPALSLVPDALAPGIEALTGVNLKTSPQRDALHMALRLAAYRLAAP